MAEVDATSLEGQTLPVTESEARALRETVTWMRGFLGRPHPHLGRTGSVCPAINRALQQSLIFFAAGPTVEDEAVLRQSVIDYRDLYLSLEPKSGEEMWYKSVVIVFAGLAESEYGLIDRVQASLKNDFVPHGLMLGQFHPTSQEPGVRCPHFRPLRSPHPLLAIRVMVPGDLLFLTGSREHFNAYCARYSADEVPSELRSKYDLALQQHGT